MCLGNGLRVISRLPYKLILLANSLANEASQNAHVALLHSAFALHLLRILTQQNEFIWKSSRVRSHRRYFTKILTS